MDPTGIKRAGRRSLRFHKVVRAPLPFVYRWCTDYRDDDDELTNDIYRYRAQVVLREPRRLVRVIVVPGRDRNRSTEVEVISLRPPDRWSVRKYSVTDDRVGRYKLARLGPQRTSLAMDFRETWKISRIPSRTRYRALFNVVWDRYVSTMERTFNEGRGGGSISRPARTRRVRERTS